MAKNTIHYRVRKSVFLLLKDLATIIFSFVLCYEREILASPVMRLDIFNALNGINF